MINLCERPFYLNKAESEKVFEKVSAMSLIEKVGQLFCILGDAYSQEELLRLVKDFNVGSVLFRPCKTNELIEKYACLDKVVKLPLLKVANLEEGGNGAVIDGIHFASQMQIAASSNIEYVDDLADACAYDALNCGINYTFSPVADINVNFQNPITNIRTYGIDANIVSKYVCRYVKRIQSYNIASAVKHFPGDGVDYRDQHLHPTYNTLSYEQWQATFGQVYSNAIDSGVLSVMVGHIVAPYILKHFDENMKEKDMLPSSLSKVVLTDFLRNSLHFNGLIVSDATIMGGFCNVMPRKEAIITAINSGCDMLVFNTDFYEDYQSVLVAVANSTLSINRIDEAVTRILALKRIVCEKKKAFNLSKKKIICAREKCAKESITLVKNVSNVIPLKKYTNVSIIMFGDNNVDNEKITDVVQKFFANKGISSKIFDAKKSSLEESRKINKDTLKLYIANIQPKSDVTTARIFWSDHFALDMPRYPDEDSVFISFGNPYHLQDIPRIKCYINCYCATLITVEKTLEKLFDGEFTGTSPIDAFCGLMDTKI